MRLFRLPSARLFQLPFRRPPALRGFPPCRMAWECFRRQTQARRATARRLSFSRRPKRVRRERFLLKTQSVRNSSRGKANDGNRCNKIFVVAVNILLPVFRQIVYSSAILYPFDVEILPERSRALVEHSAVIVFEHFHGGFRAATPFRGGKNVITHKGRKSLRSARGEFFGSGVFILVAGKIIHRDGLFRHGFSPSLSSGCNPEPTNYDYSLVHRLCILCVWLFDDDYM